MTDTCQKAFNEGYDAYMAGFGDSINPYDVSTDEFLSWNDGYNKAAEETEG